MEDLYTSLKAVRIIQIKRVGWAWHVAPREISEMHAQFQRENMKESYCPLDKSIDGVELLGHGDEHSGSLDQRNEYQLLKGTCMRYLTITSSQL